jgi:hypothetical protein
MATIFYDHLIPWEKIEIHIHRLNLGHDERMEIIELIEETVHTETLIIILRYLPKEKHEEFIEKFHAAPHDKGHLDFLKEHTHPDLEEHLKKDIENMVMELVREILREAD